MPRRKRKEEGGEKEGYMFTANSLTFSLHCQLLKIPSKLLIIKNSLYTVNS